MAELVLTLPEYHEAQQEVVNSAKRFNVLCCGRRFGKTLLGIRLLIEKALEGHPVAWFSPTVKDFGEVWLELLEICKPITVYANKNEYRIHLVTGGTIEIWSLEDKDAGRSRKYKRVIIDEAALARDLEYTWTHSIRPTLTDLKGDAWFLSTPRGYDYFYNCWLKGQPGSNYRKGWASWQMPTARNTSIAGLAKEIEDAKAGLPEPAFNQEYLAIPAADGGCPFEGIEDCIIEDIDYNPGVVVQYGVDVARKIDFTCIIGLDAENTVAYFDHFRKSWAETEYEIIRAVGSVPTAIDETGAGSSTAERLHAEYPNIVGVNFTGKKQLMMETLRDSIIRGEIKFHKDLHATLISELRTFRYEYKTGGGIKYSAPNGMHDDTVCALGLCLLHKKGSSGRPIRARVINLGTDDDDNDGLSYGVRTRQYISSY